MTTLFFDKDEAAASIATRDQIAPGDTWDLTALYPHDAAWQEAFAGLQRDYEGVVQFRGRVGESAATLRAVCEFEKELGLRIERINHYASLKSSEDSSNAENLAREAQLQNLLTRIGEASSFVEPEVMAIDDATFALFLADPLLADWAVPLRKRRRLKPHTLSAAEERLLALGHSALTGHDETFSQLTNVDLKFGTILDDKGVEVALSQSSWSSLLNKRDADLRKRTFHQFYGEFDDHKFTLASTLASSVKADVFRARSRHYPSALEGALFGDDVPASVYDNLIGSVRANLAPLFRYFALRRRVLGLAEIHQDRRAHV